MGCTDTTTLRLRLPGCMLVWLLLLLAAALTPQAARSAGEAATAAAAPAPVRVMNRSIATLNVPMLGLSPQTRALEAERRIKRALDAGGALEVGIVKRAEGTLLQIDGAGMFLVTPGDTAENTVAATAAEAERAAALLQQAIDESREGRNLKALAFGAAVAAAASAVLLLLLWALRRARAEGERWIVGKTLAHADMLRVGGVEVVRRDGVVRLERLLLNAVFWLLVLLLLYEWLSVVLGRFPFTRPWAEQLNGYLFGLLGRFALAILHAIPDLLAAALIFWLAWLLTRTLRRFFGSVASGRLQLSWLGADVALTTSRLCVAAVWLFALAMAYPYLPGSDTEAFRGLSVLVGLMISLGASNLVGQLASGLILTYTRTYHVGEYVRVGDHEGTVTALGTFTTRIRTGMGEELTISNTQVLGAVTRNYSRTVKGAGFIVETTVTIGYDAPWRQVVAMLEQAARRTHGVLDDPKPQVFQIALSDFYPEYRLVCQAVPADPRPRALVLSELHANIQDVFNEHGVQIMSPHYLGDPAEAKMVLPAKWFAPPAKPPAA